MIVGECARYVTVAGVTLLPLTRAGASIGLFYFSSFIFSDSSRLRRELTDRRLSTESHDAPTRGISFKYLLHDDPREWLEQKRAVTRKTSKERPNHH